MRTLNLGILAHVDAGKTSLTERLLHAAGVIDRIGSVDDGNTQTDTLALERRRGITIKSAVVSFILNDIIVNLIDTPGHPDFIAEVERVLSVLDGAVLVVSAVEGVQAQTRVLMRALKRLNVPTLIFVNKIDRAGAVEQRVLARIGEALTPAILPMGSVEDPGTRQARFAPFEPDDPAFQTRLTERLAENDEEVLAAFVEGRTLPDGRLREALKAQTRQAQVHPLFFGSAVTGAGIEQLVAGISQLLPASQGDADGPVSGTVFKVERGRAGEKIAYLRMFSGTVHARDRLQFGAGKDAKVTAIGHFERGAALEKGAVAAGQIGKLWGLADIRIGDAIGVPRAGQGHHHFAPPTLETVIVPKHSADKGALHAALVELAEQDPLINLRQDDIGQEMFVSLYGEVQKEVIEATLASDYGIEVEFRGTTTICIERPAGTGAAIELMGASSNPFIATVGLRIDPGPPGSGFEFRLEAELRTIPLYVYKTVDEFGHAIEATVRDTLAQGLLGWQVSDCIVTMTHSNYNSPSTTAGDFRKLTPLVLMDAMKSSGTLVCEPVHRFHLDIPGDTLGTVLPALARLGAIPEIPQMRGASSTLEGTIRAACVGDLQRQLPGLTHGEGMVEYTFDSYQPVHGETPVRHLHRRHPGAG
ncbi:elongation factor G [Devosia nitrariae]|uniref:Tetracycline resistance protein, tetM/tetO subfamily n=1 Tax=Devosia nitrariae TaxID=2071872 RepID=A0ABQ5WAL3_9HYPH|nr:TetM/TetW/TetO/TetS family tetracycline resistance ribosomal protection protein [Devosia nitrariae]GLQ57111.1 tetracycline resistance protein, tetM/tetO subfamily [Devosia nitrariae]